MNIEQSEASQSDDFRKKIYEETTTHLTKLMNNLKNAESKLKLQKLNKQIKEQNLRDKLLKENLQNFIIQISIFIFNFEMTQVYFKTLEKNSNDDITRQKIININNMLT